MAEISIVQEHRLSPEMARAAARKVANKMAADYGLDCNWIDDDRLRFGRDGLEGTLTLGEQRAAVHVTLGTFMGMMAPAIEAKMAESMRTVFGGA
jgi:putative polyhydroxyalkanoate system protein